MHFVKFVVRISRDLFRKRSCRKSKRRSCSPLGTACLSGNGATNPSTPIGMGPLDMNECPTPPSSAQNRYVHEKHKTICENKTHRKRKSFESSKEITEPNSKMELCARFGLISIVNCPRRIISDSLYLKLYILFFIVLLVKFQSTQNSGNAYIGQFKSERFVGSSLGT